MNTPDGKMTVFELFTQLDRACNDTLLAQEQPATKTVLVFEGEEHELKPPAEEQDISRERELLREEQTETVMPMIGSLLDRWEDLPGDVKSDPELSALKKSIENILMAMEGEDTLLTAQEQEDG